MEKFSIRTMKPADIDCVVAIEQEAFDSTAWDASIFVKELEGNPFGHYFVVQDKETIAGYIGLWIVEDHAQITTIAVANPYQRQGIGKLLMQFGMLHARKHDVDMMSLEVVVDNTKAKQLYERFGFNYGGIRKNYYGPNQDAIVMWVNLNE